MLRYEAYLSRETIMKSLLYLATTIAILAFAAVPAIAAPHRGDNTPNNHPHGRVSPSHSNGHGSGKPAPSGGHHRTGAPNSNRSHNHVGHPNNNGGNSGSNRNNRGHHNYGGGRHDNPTRNSRGTHGSGANHRHSTYYRDYFPFVVNRILDDLGQSWTAWNGSWDEWDRSWNQWDDSWDTNWDYGAFEQQADKTYIESRLRDLVDRARDDNFIPVLRKIGHIRDSRTWTVTVPAGRYTVFSSGGRNIDDLAVRVTDMNGRLVAEDDESNASPSVWFDSDVPAIVLVETQVGAMNDGADEDYVCILLCER
jgi:hypothetical protein